LFIQISDFIVYSFGGKIHTATRQHASESGERKQAKNIYTILKYYKPSIIKKSRKWYMVMVA